MEVSLEEASVPGLPPPRARGDAVEELVALLAQTTGHGRPAVVPDSLSLDDLSLSAEISLESVEVIPLDEVPYAPPISVADIPVRTEDTGSGTWDEDIEISDPEANYGEFLDWLETGVQPPVAEDSSEMSAIDEAVVDQEPADDQPAEQEAASPDSDAPAPTQDDAVEDESLPDQELEPEAIAETAEVIAETEEAIAETAEVIAETAEVIAETEEAIPEPGERVEVTEAEAEKATERPDLEPEEAIERPDMEREEATERAAAEPEEAAEEPAEPSLEPDEAPLDDDFDDPTEEGDVQEIARTMEDTSDVGLAVTEEALPLDEVLADVSGQREDPGSLTDEGPAETEEMLLDEDDDEPAVTEDLGVLPEGYEVQPTGQEPPVADSSFDIPVEAPERTHAETEPSLEPPPITIDEPTLRDEPAEAEEPTEPASLQDLMAAAASLSLDLTPDEDPVPSREPDDSDEDTEYVTSRFDRDGPWVAPLDDELLPWPVAVVGLTEVLPGEWSPPAGHSLSGPMPAGTGTHEEELELDLAPELELDLDSVGDVILATADELEPAVEAPADGGSFDSHEVHEAPPGSLDAPVSVDVARDSVASSESKEDWLRGLEGQPEVSVGYDVEIIPSVTMEEPVPTDPEQEPDLPTQLTSKVELERALAQLEGAEIEEPMGGGGAATHRVPPPGDDAPTQPLDATDGGVPTRRVELPHDHDEPPTLVERPEPIRPEPEDEDRDLVGLEEAEPAPEPTAGAEVEEPPPVEPEPVPALDPEPGFDAAYGDDDDDELVTEVRSPEDLEAALVAAGLASARLPAVEDGDPPTDDEPELRAEPVSPPVEPPSEPRVPSVESTTPAPQVAAAVVTIEPTRERLEDAGLSQDDLSLDDLEVDDLELDELDLDPSVADAQVPAPGLAPLPRSLTVDAVVSTLRAVREERHTASGEGAVWLELGDPVGTPPGSGGARPLWLELDDPGPEAHAETESRTARIELDDDAQGLTSLTLEGTDDEPASAPPKAPEAAAGVHVELDLGTAPPNRGAATQGVAVAPAEPIRSWQGKPVPDADPTTDLVALARLGETAGQPPATGPAGPPGQASSAGRSDDWLDEVARAGDPDDEAPMSPYYVDTQPVQVPDDVREAARISIGTDPPKKPRRRRRRRKKK